MHGEDDSMELYAKDWVRAGGYISDRNLVWEAVTASKNAAERLEREGMEFMTRADGARDLYRGAGHSVARGLTVASPNMVFELRKEAERRGVTMHEDIMVTKLLKRNDQAAGAFGISRDRNLFVFNAKAVVLAAGGANRLYPCVASPLVAPEYRTTGDGFCLALDVGAPLVDMEFAQFRDSPPGASRFGGKYLNQMGERFMEKYEPKALEKAPRNRVVAGIYMEMQAGRGPIIWEVAGMSEEEARKVFGKEFVIRERIEVKIDFQRLMGGVWINERAETPIQGLFAAGESAGGLHGGDRMQGNGFLETQVFGTHAGRSAGALAATAQREEIDPVLCEKEQKRLEALSGGLDPAEVTRLVERTMWEQVGIVRDGVGLANAIAKLGRIRSEMMPRLSGEDLFAALEAANLCLTAEIVARAALHRQESRCTHIRRDYPETDDANWMKHVCVTGRAGEFTLSTVPIVGTS
jgi:fumarate reductase (CoM/CoB) subunit A